MDIARDRDRDDWRRATHDEHVVSFTFTQSSMLFIFGQSSALRHVMYSSNSNARENVRRLSLGFRRALCGLPLQARFGPRGY